MHTRLAISTLLASALLAGCQSGPPWNQQMEPTALDMAVRQGAFEMNCPGATGQVLSSQIMQPVVNRWVYRGPERAEYEVGVSGCGKRTSYVVICPDNGSKTCFTAGSRTEVQQD